MDSSIPLNVIRLTPQIARALVTGEHSILAHKNSLLNLFGPEVLATAALRRADAHSSWLFDCLKEAHEINNALSLELCEARAEIRRLKGQ